MADSETIEILDLEKIDQPGHIWLSGLIWLSRRPSKNK
jgi:hypothetical protein